MCNIFYITFLNIGHCYFYLSFIFLIAFVQSSHQAAKSINLCVCVCVHLICLGLVPLRQNHDCRASRQVVSLVTDDGSAGFNAMNRLAECHQHTADGKRGKCGWLWSWVRYKLQIALAPRIDPRGTPEVHGVGGDEWRPMRTDGYGWISRTEAKREQNWWRQSWREDGWLGCDDRSYRRQWGLKIRCQIPSVRCVVDCV